MKFEGL